MPAYWFGRRSRERLSTCCDDLQRVMNAAIADPRCPHDFTIIEGYRTRERQAELYAQGRTTPGPIVTWTLNSRHCESPSSAVDIGPCDERGNVLEDRIDLFDKLGAYIEQVAGEVGVRIEWGGRWEKRKDRPHYQVRR